MEQQKQEEGVTFGELCRMIGKRIWMIVAIAAAVAVAATLLTVFAINPNTVSYSLEFSLSYPESGDYKYPDGSPFNYRDMISYGSLLEAKESDSRFSDVDIRTMLEEDDISVTADLSDSGEYTGDYTITVKGSYFSGKTVAADFIRAVAYVPIARAKSLAASVDYRLDQDVFDSAIYADRLVLLADQKEMMLAQYDEWIELYRENYAVSGKTLKNYRAELSVIYSDTIQESLTEELESYGYVPVEDIDETKEMLEAERAYNESVITYLRGILAGTESASGILLAAETDDSDSSASDSSGTSQITITSEPSISEVVAQLVLRNATIDVILSTLSQESVEAYEAKLQEQYDQLAAAASTLTAVSAALYDQASSVNFATSKAVASDDIGAVFVAVASLLLAFIVVSLIVCAFDYKKERKAERTEETGDETRTE